MNLKRPNLNLKRPSLKKPTLKRPSIGGPQIRVPKFAADVVADLRDRRLLPLVAVILVAIVAVPFVLARSESASDDAAMENPAAIAPQNEVEVPTESRFVAVAEDATLRDYRDRLRALSPKNPFDQQFTAPDLAGSELNDPVAAPSSTSTTTTFEAPDTGGGATFNSPSGGGHGDGGATKTKTVVETEYLEYTIDVNISVGGHGVARKKSERSDVAEGTKLPGARNPVVLFMGTTNDHKKALFLVSSRVESIYGDAKCLLGSDRCQLLAVEPRFPTTFVLEGGARNYQINVKRIESKTSSTP